MEKEIWGLPEIKNLEEAGLGEDKQAIYDLGINFVEEGKFNEAIECFEKLKEICEERREYELAARTCEKIGDCYSRLGREDKRIEYYKFAEEFYKGIKKIYTHEK